MKEKVSSHNSLEASLKILNKNISELNKKYKRDHSFKFNFQMSVIRGVGTAIGATIIAGILLAILARTIDSVQDVPILNKLLESDVIQKIGE